MRLLTSHPPSIGSETEAFSVLDGAVASIERTGTKTLVGLSIAFSNTSDEHVSALWDFGDGASPATSTSTDGTTTYSSPDWKTVKLTITDALGCSSTAVVEQEPRVANSGFEVLTCEVSIDSEANVLEPGPHSVTASPS